MGLEASMEVQLGLKEELESCSLPGSIKPGGWGCHGPASHCGGGSATSRRCWLSRPIRLSERGRTQKATHCMIPGTLIWHGPSVPFGPRTPEEGGYTTIKSPWLFSEEFGSGCAQWPPSQGETPVDPTFQGQGHTEQLVHGSMSRRGHRRI